MIVPFFSIQEKAYHSNLEQRLEDDNDIEINTPLSKLSNLTEAFLLAKPRDGRELTKPVKPPCATPEAPAKHIQGDDTLEFNTSTTRTDLNPHIMLNQFPAVKYPNPPKDQKKWAHERRVKEARRICHGLQASLSAGTDEQYHSLRTAVQRTGKAGSMIGT